MHSDAIRRIITGEHHDPHRILGAHPITIGKKTSVVVRAYHPDASRAYCQLADGTMLDMAAVEGGLFAAILPDAKLPLRYSLRFEFADDSVWERGDPYRFLPTLGDVDLHLFNEGTHRRLWEKLGAHPRVIDGEEGVAFAVWAPTALRVSVVGEWCGWDGRLFPMRFVGASGVWELFVPGVHEGALYKYEILTHERFVRLKTDPFAFGLELPPATASRVVESRHEWGDDWWVADRARRDHAREPMLIYEVHLGSWARVVEDDNRSLTYREIAPRLASHVKSLGFTHIELLPVAEHPFYGSWGYQVSGYFAPTARYGEPDDFRFFMDHMHQAGIGVILDWVPAHFPKDDFALRRFDGTALYEHEDPMQGEHPDWGTLIFNYGRNEIRCFLIATALYWLAEYHVDGLRVDAVASMLYLDYSRDEGEWKPNQFGGRENLEAVAFLQQLNETIRAEYPGCMTIAEESTAWPGVTQSVHDGGLGFTFKWNMGWMHDTLSYFSLDPIYRAHHHNELTFAMVYEYSERFIMPISHDEVVHLKKSLLEKMPGDSWQKFASLRLLLAYQYTRPGKKLLFMGTEIATHLEWNHDTSLDWHLADDPVRKELLRWMKDLGQFYTNNSPLWREDHAPDGFRWIDVDDRQNSVVSYQRQADGKHVVVVLNLTPVPRENYRIGAPAPGAYRRALSSDDRRYGGSELFETYARVETEAAPFHGYRQSMVLRLPPLGALILVPELEV